MLTFLLKSLMATEAPEAADQETIIKDFANDPILSTTIFCNAKKACGGTSRGVGGYQTATEI